MLENLNTRTLRLPFPPSLNRAYRAAAGRVLLSKPARQYAVAVRNALPPGRPERIEGRLFVVIELWPPAKLANKAWDVANREKLICDALTKAGFWRDDSQIDSISLMRWPYAETSPLGAARVTVTILSA